MHELFRQPYSRRAEASTSRPRDLLDKQYREVGISAVASALTVRSLCPSSRQSDARKGAEPNRDKRA